MKRIFYSISVLFIVLFFTGCSKSGNSPSTPKGILTSGKWQMQSSVSDLTIAGRAPDTEDTYAKMDACERDNYYIFNADGTGTNDEGATKCNAGDPQTEKDGNWALLNNDTQLRLSDPTEPSIVITADILELNDSRLKIKYTVIVPGITAITTTVFTHIK